MTLTLLEQYDRDGYVVLPEKIPAEIIDAINHAFDDAPNHREKILLRRGGNTATRGRWVLWGTAVG